MNYLLCHLKELKKANVEIKDFNDLIDRKSFFDLPIKNEEEAYKKRLR